jgi:hypothetical protein
MAGLFNFKSSLVLLAEGAFDPLSPVSDCFLASSKVSVQCILVCVRRTMNEPQCVLSTTADIHKNVCRCVVHMVVPNEK